jgi:metal-sulfur cluster biosynthetic enzyme
MSECNAVLLTQLARVLDPELDEPITELGFVRSARLRDGDAEVELGLPTGWCAVNFAFLMAEDIRAALLATPGVRQATVRLGDHCAAEPIEAAVNSGMRFEQAFPDEGCDSLDALRQTFRRKGFLARQFRLLQALRNGGWSFAAIGSLLLGEVSAAPDMPTVDEFEPLRRYLERRAELGLDCRPTAPLIIDPDGKPLTGRRLEDHYLLTRTVRSAMEANGAFCRAVLAVRDSRTG